MGRIQKGNAMNKRESYSRREMLAASGTAIAAATLGGRVIADEQGTVDRPSEKKRGPVKLQKAVKFGMVAGDASILDKFKLVRDLGYDGIEMMSPTELDRREILEASEKSGLPIHGAVNGLHWKKPLSHPDPAVREECVESIRTALRDVKFWGGTSMLLVPAKVDETMPYDAAYRRSQAEIRKVLPLAESLDVKILIENVWNNFLLSPLEMARYIDAFDSPAIGSYFDVGNVVRGGWPEQWIRILGHRIVKLDIKEYDRKKRDNEGLWKGFQVKIGEGSVDWAAVMEALRDIGFSGWATAEVKGGDRERLADIARRMDKVFAM